MDCRGLVRPFIIDRWFVKVCQLMKENTTLPHDLMLYIFIDSALALKGHIITFCFTPIVNSK